MRRLMGVTKDRHGTYYAQQKVPERLQVAVARVLGNNKPRQVNLKKSLGTKSLAEANVRAKPVLAGFDQILKRATEVVAAQNAPRPPKRQSLNPAEIARMTEAFFGKMLATDEDQRFGGRAYIARAAEWMNVMKTTSSSFPTRLKACRSSVTSPEQFVRTKRANCPDALATAREILAMGDIKAIEDELTLLLYEFHIRPRTKEPVLSRTWNQRAPGLRASP